MLNKDLRKKLLQGGTVVGTWCEIPSWELINVIAKSGIDFIIVDMEHGTMDFEKASAMVVSAQAEGCNAFIRVPENNSSSILRSLESDPDGIIVPHVSSVQERSAVVKSFKLPPEGNRSFNPYTRAGGYKLDPKGSSVKPSQLLAIIIESREGVEAVEKIIDDRGVDIVYVGVYDLSMALGERGDINNPQIRDSMKKIVKVAKAKNKIVGGMFHTEEEFKILKKMGLQFLCYKVDTAVIFDSYRKVINLLQK